MNKREFIENVIFYGIIIAIVYLAGKYLLPTMIPFIIGFIIAYLAHQLSKKTTEDMSKSKKVVALIAIYTVLVIVVFFAIAYFVDRIKDIVTYVASYSGNIEALANELLDNINRWSANLPSEAKELMGTITSAALDGLQKIALTIVGSLSGFLTSVVTSIPSLFLSIVVAIISSFYILLDYDRVVTSLKRLVPKRIEGIVIDLKRFVQNKLFKIIKSYAVIMGLTCVELVIGLFISGTPHAILLSVLISILDILPVLGVGTALIPWAVIDLVLGNTLHGILLLIVYIIITVVRNIVEPKLVGEDLGLDPLTTLVAMIVGMQLFGIIGLFGIPLGLSFILYAREQRKQKKV